MIELFVVRYGRSYILQYTTVRHCSPVTVVKETLASVVLAFG